ncbi:MAG: aminoacyl-histidine dipeptidase [Bacteroidetes bacterium]|nr:MAG: aminoacyl-histidine dipeptidase [Bacteroidota bacterium]
MENPILSLAPERLWYYFDEICKVPRPSKHEEKIARFLLGFASRHGLEGVLDETGNVLIRKPASAGYDNRKTVILQSHMDMVGEKNSDKAHDFTRDPITPWIDGNWVKARGTTLGADCGIGIATTLAILESDEIDHPPLEALFTMDEETGLTGAFGLKSDLLQGRILINLDSEDEGQIFIGCAGGIDTIASFLMETEDPPVGQVAYEISITGLVGGHSGDDINKGRGNAVKILDRFLWNAAAQFDARIAAINAGNLRNALAREGFSWIVIPSGSTHVFESYIGTFREELHDELHVTEPELKFAAILAEMPSAVLAMRLQERLLNALYACPHGVIAMSREIEHFVETSTNLASVKMQGDQLVVTTSQRSSVESSKKDAGDMVASLFHLAEAKVEQTAGYPGWKPNPDSEILRLTITSYKRLFNQEPEVLAIHAGLECGLIGAIYPGMDMVSFGPTIKGAHSPDERLDIPTTVKFWDLLLDVLKHIPKR